MAKSCVAAGCANTSNDSINFFKFPSDPVLRQQWTRQVQKTRDHWSGPTKRSIMCIRHFTKDCFEPNSAIEASMGLTKWWRLKPNTFPTVFERQAPVHSSRPCGSGVCPSRKRAAATTTAGATGIGGTTQIKKPRQAYEKRERSRVRNGI